MLLRAFILCTALVAALSVNQAAEPSLGQTLKKIFATPTPTPHHKKKPTSTKKKSPTPSATAKTSASATPRTKKKVSATPSATPSPSVHRKKKSSPTPSSTETPSPPGPSSTTIPSPHGKKKTSPSPTESESPAPASTKTPSPPGSPKHGAPNASLSPEQIKGFENYPEGVKKILMTALDLTGRNLTYQYGSDDPSSGGMDCSGFVYYVLKQNGVADVPRDSSAQYIWLRRAGKFEPVISRKDNTFELENLRPGDLLFWTGTYAIDRDPPITHAMIYLGREKKTGERVMVGASDGRVYQGESRYGVSVFDFKLPHPETNGNGKLQPTFVGYGHIPGLGN